IRSLHRFSADAAVVAIAVHAVRMLARGRSWGPRTLAWISGLVLTGIFFVIGWTGYVMVWDVHGQALAMEGARFLDALPIFSVPVSRTFIGERPLPGAVFFLNYFLHIALPLGIGLVLYIHVSRLARPTLMPPRRLTWTLTGLLTALAVFWPVPLGAPADPGRLPDTVILDWFYGFWMPVTRLMPGWAVWTAGGALALLALLVPLLTRPRSDEVPRPSTVDHRLCTGCEQCFVDCPYEAISMIPRDDDRPSLVADVDPALCVSCGICAGSCAPMGVGPPERTGRDQLERVRSFVEERTPGASRVVLVACAHGAGELGGLERFHDALVYPLSCAGNLHTSVVELLLRGGAGGVMVAACPGRDCWNREGPRWTTERLFHDREAELQARVDRRRVRLVYAGAGDRGPLARALASFQAEVAALEPTDRDKDLEVDAECDVPEHEGLSLKSGIRT
ncbi:MAG TPA: hydrogenase iron-sulfur subunit, partial [Longimicrobiales bacterium]|nr:hydrogenase iron-sulfur subunit [Longimicrobiales bacterium]